MIPCPFLFTQKPIPSSDLVDESFHVFSGYNIANVYFWSRIFQKMSEDNVKFNSIVECGVGRGRSLITLSMLAEIYISTGQIVDDNIEIFALDSFEGFPEPTDEDRSFRNPRKGEWSYSPSGMYKYSPDFISRVLINADVPCERIELIPGYFDTTTLSIKTKASKIGILHCDGDLYMSVKSPLDNLWRQVVKGGFIVFDDFILEDSNPDAFPGSRKAFEEFVSLRGDYFELFTSPRGNVILRKIKD
jgi:hypothetical protein